MRWCLKIDWFHVQGWITNKQSNFSSLFLIQREQHAPGCSFQQLGKKSIKDILFSCFLCSNIMFSIHSEDHKGTQHAVFSWWNIVMPSFRMLWQTQFQISAAIVVQTECLSPKGLNSNLATLVMAWQTASPGEFLWDKIKITE